MPKKGFVKIFDLMIIRFMPIVLSMLFILFPIYWTVVTALKKEGDILKKPIKYLPDTVTFYNFINSWEKVGFSTYFKNSLIVSIASCVLIMLISMFVGYALSRYDFKGKNVFMLVLLCTQFIPGAMLIVPLFIIFKKMMLINNFLSLILLHATTQVPFNAILMRGFIANVPYQLEEAAYIDGCGKIKTILNVILPLLVPALVAVAAFSFIGSWNEFIYALMFINKQKLFTIQVGLSFMIGEFDVNYGALAAGSIIAVLPAFALFAYVQRFLVGGMTAGSVKG